jgi:hypothetical protein
MSSLPAEYVRAGLALVLIPRGEKGPRAKGWNLRENTITDPGRAAVLDLERFNVGLAHAYSGTCAIDFDRLDEARAWLAERGVDVDALLSSPYAVKISSGRPNRAKLIYKLATPLRTLALADGAFELRCATSKQTSVQDALPPSLHPDTGQPYRWEFGNDLIGDWRDLPELPPQLRALWESLVAVPERIPTERNTAATIDEHKLRELLKHHSPAQP